MAFLGNVHFCKCTVPNRVHIRCEKRMAIALYLSTKSKSANEVWIYIYKQLLHGHASDLSRSWSYSRCGARVQLLFVGTHFPSCYKCSWENGPDNWIQLTVTADVNMEKSSPKRECDNLLSQL